MFSGIIKGRGEVVNFDDKTFVLKIKSPVFATRTLSLGASIAIDGVCLSLTNFDREMLTTSFDLGEETRSLTLLPQLRPHDEVNIEFSLAIGDSVDGHLVQGHVDGLAQILMIEPINHGLLFKFKLPKKLAPMVVKKGSIAINGVSLTVNEVEDDEFTVCLVPITLELTTFKNLKVADVVHVETDVVGRYLYNFYQHEKSISIS